MSSPITSAPPRSAVPASKPWIVTLVVLLHAVVVVLHGNAHTSLGVGLSSWQRIYVLVVIVIAPFVAGVFAWTPRWARFALFVLLFSMAGSLIFGACYHYLIVSPDNVAHLPAGEARGMFRSTAMLLFVTEALGVIVALLGLRASRT